MLGPVCSDALDVPCQQWAICLQGPSEARLASLPPPKLQSGPQYLSYPGITTYRIQRNRKPMKTHESKQTILLSIASFNAIAHACQCHGAQLNWSAEGLQRAEDLWCKRLTNQLRHFIMPGNSLCCVLHQFLDSLHTHFLEQRELGAQNLRPCLGTETLSRVSWPGRACIQTPTNATRC